MVALPVALSPLLLSAARPPASDSISATCSLEESATYAPTQTEGANVSYRRTAGGQAESSNRAEAAGSEATAFVRDRWNAVRHLIRENPYLNNGTSQQQAEAEALCLAQIRSDRQGLLAQAATDDQPQIPSLPDLGAVPSETPRAPAPENDSEPTLETPSEPTLETPSEPAIEPAQKPAIEAPSEPTLETPSEPTIETPSEPVVPPSALPVPQQPTPAADPSALPTAKDPSTYMGPEGNPTPFDGIVAKTLSDLPDGNYRYIFRHRRRTSLQQ